MSILSKEPVSQGGVNLTPIANLHSREQLHPRLIDNRYLPNTIPAAFSTPQQIAGQGTSTPAISAFTSNTDNINYLYMVYRDSSSSQLWVSRSLDGLNWQDTQQIAGQDTSTVPAISAFTSNTDNINYLYMVYSDSNSSQLWVSRSLDGLNWQNTQQIAGQNTSIPAISAFTPNTGTVSYLYMIYSDSNSSQLWVSRSLDGLNWQDTQQIVNQGTSVPAIAAFTSQADGINYLYMVYSDSISSQLWVSRSVDGLNWQDTQQIAGQFTSTPAIAVFDGYLYMVYSGSTNSQLWVTCSADGLNWSNPVEIQGQSTSVPALAVYQQPLYLIYTDSGSSQLWVSYCDSGPASSSTSASSTDR